MLRCQPDLTLASLQAWKGLRHPFMQFRTVMVKDSSNLHPLGGRAHLIPAISAIICGETRQGTLSRLSSLEGWVQKHPAGPTIIRPIRKCFL